MPLCGSLLDKGTKLNPRVYIFSFLSFSYQLLRLRHNHTTVTHTTLQRFRAVMGNCTSGTQDREASQRSADIDRIIEEDSKKFKKECKILLLGK
jgi:hypothetical protein